MTWDQAPSPRSTFRATIDIPARFRNSKAVGPILGLTPVLHRVGRKPPHRPDIPLRRRHDANAALRSRADTANARDEMVVAEGVGDECCQAARPTEGHCRISSPAGGDHASHVARRHRVSLDATRHHAEGRLIVRPTIAACRRAQGPVKGKSRRADLRPPLTGPCARRPSRNQVGTVEHGDET